MQSATGQLQIAHKIRRKLLKSIGIEHTCSINIFILPKLISFEVIIGDDTLKELGDHKPEKLYTDPQKCGTATKTTTTHPCG